jgi:hypothetical protein
VFLVGCDEDQMRPVSTFGVEQAGNFYPVHLRHAHIEEDGVGSQVCHLAHRVCAVTGLANDF